MTTELGEETNKWLSSGPTSEPRIKCWLCEMKGLTALVGIVSENERFTVKFAVFFGQKSDFDCSVVSDGRNASEKVLNPVGGIPLCTNHGV